MNEGSVQWQKVEQRLGKGRMGARKRKMIEAKGERESDATKVGEVGEEARGRKANGERGRLYYILLCWFGASEREHGGRIRMEWMPGIDRSG